MSMWIKKVAVTPLNTIAKVINSLTSDSTTNAPSIHAVKTALNGKANSSHTHTKSQITDFPSFETTTQDFTVNVSVSSTLPSDIFTIDVTKSGWKPLGLLGFSYDSGSALFDMDYISLSDLGSVGASVNGQVICRDTTVSRTATLRIRVGYYKFE